MNHKENNKEKQKTLRKTAITKRRFFSLSTTLAMLPVMFITAFAEEEAAGPETVLNKFVDFLFTVTRVIGIVGCLFGLVQIGMSFKSHDVTQRDIGIMALLGSLIILFAKEILTSIGVSL